MAKSSTNEGIVHSDFSARLGKLTGAAKAVKAPAVDVMEMALGAGVDLGPMGTLRWVDVGQIDDSPFQTREEISDAHINSLIESLDGQGLIEIPPARWGENGRVQIGAGHCRTEAVRCGANAGSQLPQPERFAGKMLFLIKERSDLEMAAIAVDENVVRENPNPIELARGYRHLKNVLESEGLAEGATWDVVAERAKVSKRRVFQTVSLLKLPPIARKRIAEGFWNEKHGRAILSAQPEHRELLMRQILREDLTGNAAGRRAGELVKTHPTEKTKLALEIASGVLKEEVERKKRAKSGKSAARLKKFGDDEPAEKTPETKQENNNGITIGHSVAGASPAENQLRAALQSVEIAVVAVGLSGIAQKDALMKKLLDIGDEIEEAAREKSVNR